MRKYIKAAKEAIRGKPGVMERPEKMNTPAAPDGRDSPYRVSEETIPKGIDPWLALLEMSLRDAREMLWDRMKVYGSENEIKVGLELYRARRMDMFGRTLCEVLLGILEEGSQKPRRRKRTNRASR